MTQRSFFWNGASIGDANVWTHGGGYFLSESDHISPLIDIVFRMVFQSDGNQGVLANWLNELAVTGAATPISVNTGGALVYGMPYQNTAAVSITVPTPTSETRNDAIVLRRDWSAQTIRIVRASGTEGGSSPTPRQSPAPDGIGIYEIPLAEIEVTTGGVITVTDTREFTTFSTAAVEDSVGTTSIVNEGVPWEAREQVTRILHIGGGGLKPISEKFGYRIESDNVQSFLIPGAGATWGATNASLEGWQCSGYGLSNKRGFIVSFRVPADHIPGTDIYALLWMTDDWNGDSTFYIQSAWQSYVDSEEVVYSGGYSSENVDTTTFVDTIRTIGLRPITGLNGGELVIYYVEYYNSSGSELMLINGIDFMCLAYV